MLGKTVRREETIGIGRVEGWSGLQIFNQIYGRISYGAFVCVCVCMRKRARTRSQAFIGAHVACHTFGITYNNTDGYLFIPPKCFYSSFLLSETLLIDHVTTTIRRWSRFNLQMINGLFIVYTFIAHLRCTFPEHAPRPSIN